MAYNNLSSSSPKHQEKHGLIIRLAHAGLAIAVINQLLTSLVLEAPAPDATGNWYFEVHEYGGLFGFGFVLLFWLGLLVKLRESPLGLLFPWFSGERLSALWADIKHHARFLIKFQFPPYENHAPLASAVHGLGLLLITAMASSGTIYYFINNGNPDAGGLVGVVIFIHKTLASLVWAYLVGHAGLALIQHYLGNVSLATMWSFRRD
tara:strand:+ start:221 stop:841 length:621 start_codon:yes stop_codon:yes gene_type:complete